MNQAFTYSAHGLCLHSSIQLPELCVGRGSGRELNIQILPGVDFAESDGFSRDDQGVRFWWREVGKFLVLPSGDIIADRNRNIPDSLFRLPLLGATLAMALRMRGKFVIHGNGLHVSGCGVAIVGAKGAGKSTLSAALIQAGHSLMSDDVTCIHTSGDGVELHPGSTQLRLWPDAAASAFPGERFRQIHPWSEKLAVLLPHSPLPSAVKLRRIFVLEPGGSPGFYDLDCSQALLQLLKHSYSAKFHPGIVSEEEAKSNFAQCAQIARSVQVTLVRQIRDLSVLPETIARIEREVS